MLYYLLSKDLFSHYPVIFYISIRKDGHGRRPATILPTMERLPVQHGQLLQALEGWEKLYGCHPGYAAELHNPLHFLGVNLNWSFLFCFVFLEACEGQTCKAHKMVLSACSPYFKSLLEVIIILLAKFQNSFIFWIRPNKRWIVTTGKSWSFSGGL